MYSWHAGPECIRYGQLHPIPLTVCKGNEIYGGDKFFNL